ncbi:hypothetical protein ACIGEZ_26675 [Streptomyces sp. NPDC085481]|uniref:hypothetical protein n=1 Tax=Streptomyces sp. NPDC085481 TaxID=3365727 RepID=UPI0037D224BC
MVRTRLKLAATLTVVVLALTGFQTSSHGGSSGGTSKSGKSKSGSKSGSGSGGGCSSSKKKNDDYDDYDGDASGGFGGSGDSTYTPSPTSSPTSGLEVVVVDCVDPAQKKRKGKAARKADTTAAVRVTARAGQEGSYRIVVEFERGDGSPVDLGEITVAVDGPGEKRYDIAMKSPNAVGQVKNCSLYDVRKQ